ncbi:MAG: ASKHA domain-containing protein [Candidatus Omnitrophota bacterium]
MPKVTFLPSNKTVFTEAGKDLLTLSRELGIFIPTGCAGEGVCGLCKVKVTGETDSEYTPSLSEEEFKKGFRLACRTILKDKDVTVEIPPRVETYHLKVESSIGEIEQKYSVSKFKFAPLIEKVYLELPKPSLNDTLSDLERVFTYLKKKRKNGKNENYETSLSNIRLLPRLLRDADFKITVTLLNLKENNNVQILNIEGHDASGKNFGVSVDIGTTTISAQLLDLFDGKVISTQAVFNKQLQWGEDVITRIVYASESGGRGLEELHHAVAANINELIAVLVKEAKITLADVNAVVCAGNTTMLHLLLKIDPSNIRKEPYTPVLNEVPFVNAADCGIEVNPRAVLVCLPSISTYVGADISAGILSSGFYREEDISLLIDIGTNGEIALGNKDWLISCAASAGPAFEGSGTSCGMKASAGAIQKIEIKKDSAGEFKISYSTVKGVSPRGICGSGYIDLLAEMFKNGIMSRDGKIISSSSLVRRIKDSRAFVVFKDEADETRDIYITEEDIENLKRSKGAIFAACGVLLKKVNLPFSKIKKIYIAGGFGRFLNIRNSVIIGLLPDLKESVFEFIGNSSLAGARDVLFSVEAHQDARKIRGMMSCVELADENYYMEEYTKALFFPHTELERFKSVKF